MPIESRSPTALAAMAREASVAIGATVNWPVSAPTAGELAADASEIETLDEQIGQLEDAIRIAREQRNTRGEQLYAKMRRVDTATDLIYGETSAQKARYGIEPKKGSGGSGPEPLRKLTISRIEDGTTSGSIFVDFDSIEGAVYEMEAASDSGFATIVATKTVTASEGTIEGLTMGTQYWIRVRALRAGESGPWSDPATRVANV